ncbi:MAG: hypothetical protein K2X82_07030 [Gemmataceae bacterium]|nr:hypothetical protein [Gemmataceae bacterium]
MPEFIKNFLEDIRDTIADALRVIWRLGRTVVAFVQCLTFGAVVVVLGSKAHAALTGQPADLLTAANQGLLLGVFLSLFWIPNRLRERNRPHSRRRPADPYHRLGDRATGAPADE